VATEGILSFTPPEDDAHKVHLMTTPVKVQGPKDFPIQVTGQKYRISIYAGKKLVASGTQKVTATPRLEVGDTHIFIIAWGGSGQITIKTPADLEISAKAPTPGVPLLADPVAEYLDHEAGSLVIDLTW